MGRFINPDSQLNLQDGPLGTNLFCYCGNDPVNCVDLGGRFGLSVTALCFIIGFVVGAIVGGTIAYNQAKEKGAEGWDLVGETVAGALGGGIVGGLLGYGGGALFSSATGILGWSITQYSVLTVKAVTILGPMPLYIEAAKSVKEGFYFIDPKLYKSLSAEVRWGNNRQYILDAASLGTHFVLLLPDFVFRDELNTISTLYLEIQLLVQMLIPFDVA